MRRKSNDETTIRWEKNTSLTENNEKRKKNKKEQKLSNDRQRKKKRKCELKDWVAS